MGVVGLCALFYALMLADRVLDGQEKNIRSGITIKPAHRYFKTLDILYRNVQGFFVELLNNHTIRFEQVVSLGNPA